jgi:hypothetical protein
LYRGGKLLGLISIEGKGDSIQLCVYTIWYASGAAGPFSKIHHKILCHLRRMISARHRDVIAAWYANRKTCQAKGNLESVALTHSDRHSGELEK